MTEAQKYPFSDALAATSLARVVLSRGDASEHGSRVQANPSNFSGPQGALTRPYFNVAVCLYISQPILGLEQKQHQRLLQPLVHSVTHACCISLTMGVNLNLSASLNIFKLLSNPSLCLPHAAVSTFRDLPIPLDSAFKRKGVDVNIRAVVLDKDDCFAVPETNEVHKPYQVCR